MKKQTKEQAESDWDNYIETCKDCPAYEQCGKPKKSKKKEQVNDN